MVRSWNGLKQQLRLGGMLVNAWPGRNIPGATRRPVDIAIACGYQADPVLALQNVSAKGTAHRGGNFPGAAMKKAGGIDEHRFAVTVISAKRSFDAIGAQPQRFELSTIITHSRDGTAQNSDGDQFAFPYRADGEFLASHLTMMAVMALHEGIGLPQRQWHGH